MRCLCKYLSILALAAAGTVWLPQCVEPPPQDGVPVYTYEVVNTYPHDPTAFTQGLAFADGFLYEGTGILGESSLRRVALETGEVLQVHKLADEFFGEGIALCQDKIIQLTWQSRTAFVYDRETFEPAGQFLYPGEGWGIAYDGTRLIMSDGTAVLRFRNPETFEETGHVTVMDKGSPVTRLNELEYVSGEVYANVWKTDRIARIDPGTGNVLGWIDLTGLLSAADRTLTADVLNGIAYDAESNRLFVTGKRWPKLFQINVVTPQDRQ